MTLADQINALPEPLRSYVIDIETKAERVRELESELAAVDEALAWLRDNDDGFISGAAPFRDATNPRAGFIAEVTKASERAKAGEAAHP